MASFAYYPSIDVTAIDSDGVRTAVPSDTFNLDNLSLTGSTAVGTAASDADGIIPGGLAAGLPGDVLQFSHATYPEVFKVTLAETPELAQWNPCTYVVEILQTERIVAKQADIYVQNLDVPNSAPFKVGSAAADTTVNIPIELPSGNWRAFVASMTDKGSNAKDFHSLPYQDFTV